MLNTVDILDGDGSSKGGEGNNGDSDLGEHF